MLTAQARSRLAKHHVIDSNVSSHRSWSRCVRRGHSWPRYRTQSGTTASLITLGVLVRHIAAALSYVADSQHETLATMRARPSPLARAGVTRLPQRRWRAVPPRDPDEYTELLCRRHPAGTPEHCLNTLTATTCRTGIDHVIVLVEGAGDRAHTLENITRRGAEILPLLQDSTPGTLS